MNSPSQARQELSIELLRPGALSGQLLSRLTPYLAIVNDVHAETIHLPMDHLDLLQLIRGITYSQKRSQQAAALSALSQQAREIFSRISMLPGLLGTQEDDKKLIHIRLTLSGNELALIPVEAAYGTSPPFGESEPLLAHTSRRVVLTRELRNSSRMPLDWTRPPRILLVGAAPPPLEPVPLRAHALALFQALRPFEQIVSHADRAGRPMKEMLTVVEDATLHDIEKLCADADSSFTHIVLLVHGVRIKKSGLETYGIALHGPGKDGRLQCVSADRLVAALRPTRPTMVLLLSCHGSAQGDVVLPMGSVAQELHESGIPWVLASQFPLSMSGSVAVTAKLFPSLLMGEDPRDLLYEIRKTLATKARILDWASLVAYAAFPSDFESQLLTAQRQANHVAESALFNRMDRETYQQSETLSAEKIGAYKKRAEGYRKQIADTMPRDIDNATAATRARVLGLLASSHRNQAFALDLGTQSRTPESRQEFLRRLRTARDLYREASRLWPSHPWYAVHDLSLSSLLGEALSIIDWVSSLRNAIHQTEASDLTTRCWGHLALLELHLLVLANHQDGAKIEALGVLLQQGQERGDASPFLHAAQHHLEQLLKFSTPDGDVLRKIQRQLERYKLAADRGDWSPAPAFHTAHAKLFESLKASLVIGATIAEK